MQPGRYYRGSEKIDSRPDRDALGEDCVEEVVHHFQRSHKAAGLYPLLLKYNRVSYNTH